MNRTKFRRAVREFENFQKDNNMVLRAKKPVCKTVKERERERDTKSIGVRSF